MIEKQVHSRSHKESGQGLVEYGLILIILVLLVFGVTKLWGWAKNRISPSTPPLTSGEPLLDIVELGVNAEIIDSEKIPLYNCNNASDYQLEVQRSRQVQHQISVEGQLQSGIGQIINIGLQGHYGIENGQSEERSYTVHLTAPANSWVEYTIEWRYVWREGEIRVDSPDGSKQIYPYRVRSGIEFNISNIITKDCNN